MTIEDKRNHFVMEVEEKEDLLDFEQIFTNNNPVHIEIGSGKGEFISKISLQHKDRNFLGVESREKRIVNILKKLSPEEHNNVKLWRVWMNEVTINKIPDYSVEQFYIFHPDPWPKRKHHKNRLINPTFIEILRSKIVADGLIVISTDHRDYAMSIVEVFKQNPNFTPKFELGYTQEPHRWNIVSFFEQKFKKLGFMPYYMEYKIK